MKTIPLTQGQLAMVDDEDFQFLLGFKWVAHKERRRWYASTSVNGKCIKMHWLILPTVKPLMVDHIDSNGLNNQRLNLRQVTNSQNCMNQRKQLNRSSKYKGVTFDKATKKWFSQIQIDGNRYSKKHLGRFVNEIDAAKAYDAAAKQYFGEYARVNF